ARALIPLLADRAPAAAARRKLQAETIAEYHAAGILRILQPRRFGGPKGRVRLFFRVVGGWAYGCASAAWVYAVLAEHQWIIARSGRRVFAGAARCRQACRWGLAAERGVFVFERLRLCAMGNPRRLSRRDGRTAHRLPAGAARRS